MREKTFVEPLPVPLGVTPYNFATSLLFVLIAALAVSIIALVMYYDSIRPVSIIRAVPVEMLELSGGAEDGSPDKTLRVDNDFPESNDASPAEIPSEISEVAEALDSMLELSEKSAEMAEQQFDVGIQNTGKVGSSKGTGARGLGSGPGKSGFSRGQRWYVSFSDRVTADEYAKQLEAFGIELGAVEADGRVAYLAKPATSNTVRRGEASTETRLFMSWQGGSRRQFDKELLTRAGIPVSEETVVVHFYSPALEQTLLKLEQDFQHRRVEEIRRTYFEVTLKEGQYVFIVIRQMLNNASR